jgi:hypothetical protein
LIDDLIPDYEAWRQRETDYLHALSGNTIRTIYLAARSGHRPALDELQRIAGGHLEKGLRPLTGLERDAREGVMLLDCLALFAGSRGD